MRARFVLLLTFAIVALSMLSIAAQSSSERRRPLRVVVYPFVPDKIGLFWLVEQSFERTHPAIDLQILDLSDNYYDQESPHAVTNTEADVLEVDSVFMQDLIDSRKIQAIPASLRASAGSMLRVAEDAVRSGSSWFGVPHWVCTNFIFSRPQDPLNAAATLDDVVNAIGDTRPAGRGLLIDLTGRLTLGELYLDALLDKYKTLANADPFVPLANRDQAVVDDLKKVRRLCDSDLCRDSEYHDRVGFYARLFARGQGRALVGYSERLYYVGDEVLSACRKGECQGLDQITMVPLPLSSKGSQPFAWVDSFAVSSKCSRQCLRDAEAFIRHTTSIDAVRAQLTPGWGEAPRYLMPALSGLYSDPELLKSAPLYSKLYPTLQNAIAVREAGLNKALRDMGAHLDKNELARD
jgi:thiamine pyridinylase